MSKHNKQSVASPFASLVKALAQEGRVVVGLNPRTGLIEARLEQPNPRPPQSHLEPARALADGDASDQHLGIPGATRGD